nr:hypothetical protein [Tanacetum cinerariifolium]
MILNEKRSKLLPVRVMYYLQVENEDDSEEEIDAVAELHVDNSISHAENELSDSEASDFDNPSFPRPPPEPPDADFELDTREEISVAIDKLEFLNQNDKFDVLKDEDRVRIPSLTLISLFRASGISLGWNFHMLSCLF